MFYISNWDFNKKIWTSGYVFNDYYFTVSIVLFSQQFHLLPVYDLYILQFRLSQCLYSSPLLFQLIVY